MYWPSGAFHSQNPFEVHSKCKDKKIKEAFKPFISMTDSTVQKLSNKWHFLRLWLDFYCSNPCSVVYCWEVWCNEWFLYMRTLHTYMYNVFNCLLFNQVIDISQRFSTPLPKRLFKYLCIPFSAASNIWSNKWVALHTTISEEWINHTI